MALTCGTCSMLSIRLALITLLLCVSTSLSQDCGGTFNDIEGEIKSPSYPSNYSNNLNCIYIITGPPGHRITLNFSDFILEDNYFCSYDFVEVRDGETDTAPVLDTKFCGSTLPGPLRSTRNFMRVQFRTDSSVNNTGFHAFYTAGVYKREMILLSLETKIIQVDIETESYIRIPIDSLQQPAALDYDPTEERIYWTDLTTTGIHSAFLNGSNDRMIRDLGSMASPEGLAIDRSSRLLVYTDAGMKVIGMMTLSGSVHRLLFDTLLDEPRAIVLDTRNGVLFWTDVGRISKIERANYDTSDRKTIVSTGLGFPNALAIDLDNNRLYWVDGGTEKLEGSNLDGSNRTEIYQVTAANFVGLALYNHHLYFTDWREDVILGYRSFLYRINTDGSNMMKIFSSYNRMDDVHVYSEASDKQESNGCGLNNGGCQYICIPLPNNRSKCACPDRQEWDDTQRACTEGQNPCNSSNGGCSDFCSPLAGNRVLCSCPIGSLLLSDQKSCSQTRPQMCACWRNLTQLQGSIQSPLYPRNYSDNADCVYIIQQPDKYRITLTFQQFSLQGGYNCLFDFLEIRDGDSATSPLLHVRFCGKELPPPQRTTQNFMWIRFKSDSKINSLGFSASYKASILPKEFILTTFEDHIVRMDIETLSYIRIQIDNVTRPMAVDYDPVGDRIYWSDVSRHEVRSSFLNGSDSSLLRALGPDALPNGIAVDSYSRLLIYSDAGQKVIAMMSISAKGSEFSHKIVFNTNLSEPQAIVLDTMNGTIFWTDIGTIPKIERGNYDGTDRRTLVRFFLRLPNALAIDLKNNRLYWVDAGTDYVEVANLDGFNRRLLWSSAGSHFYGLSLYNNELYITNWKIFSNQVYESRIYVLNTNGTELTDLTAASGQLGDIHIYSDRAEDLGSNACVNTNGGCSDMCIPLPQNTSKCLCPDLFHLSENGKTCISNITTTTTHQPSPLVTLISTSEQPSPSTTFTPTTERPSSVAIVYVIMCADTTSNFTLVCEAGDFRVTKYKWNATCAEGESVQTCTLEPKLFVDGGNAVMCTMENAEGKEFSKVFKFDSSVIYTVTTRQPSPVTTFTSVICADASSNFAVVCDAGDFRVTKYKWNVTCAERESVQTCTLEPKPFIDGGKAVMCTMENAKGEEISRVFKFDPSCTKSEHSKQRGSSGAAKAVGIAVPVTIIIVVIVVIVLIVLGRKKGFIFWNRPKPLVDEDSLSYSNLADRTGRESIRHDKCEQVNPAFQVESGVMQPVYGNTTEDIPANQSTNKEDTYMTLQL